MIKYFETHITEACNLKCRGCSHFSVFAKPKHKDIDEFRREFERLAEIEEFEVIRLMGGEPLLNPNYMEYLRIARELFPDTRVVLVTNGILAERLRPNIKELRALQIDVTMSDYHLNEQHIMMLRHFAIAERHEKGQLYNISLDPTGSQDPDFAYEHCDIREHEWFYFMDGRFYPCCIAGTIHDFWNHFGLDWGMKQEELSIDIFTHTAEEIEAFLHQKCELCRYCDTVHRVNSYSPFSRSKGDIKEWTI